MLPELHVIMTVANTEPVEHVRCNNVVGEVICCMHAECWACGWWDCLVAQRLNELSSFRFGCAFCSSLQREQIFSMKL